jgi:hypothetical protein
VTGDEQGHEIERGERNRAECEDAVTQNPAANRRFRQLDCGCNRFGQMLWLSALSPATPASYDSCQRNKNCQLQRHSTRPAERARGEAESGGDLRSTERTAHEEQE